MLYITTKFNLGKMYLDNQVKPNEGMRGPIKCYKNKDNCLLALSPQFNSGILRFMSSASSISNRLGLLYLHENKILELL